MSNPADDKKSGVIEGLIEDVKTSIRHRVQNPFLAAYFLALATANYKVVVVLLSQEPYKKSFDFIDTQLLGTPYAVITKVIVYPLAASLFFTFIWPWLNGKIVAAQEVVIQIAQTAIVKARQQRVVTVEEKVAYFSEWEAQNEQLRDAIGRLNAHNRLRIEEARSEMEAAKGGMKVVLLEIAAKALGLTSSQVAELSRDANVARSFSRDLKQAIRMSPLGSLVCRAISRQYGAPDAPGPVPVDVTFFQELIGDMTGQDAYRLMATYWALGLMSDLRMRNNTGFLASETTPAVANWLVIVGDDHF